ncbi:MAG: GNAT family N-acetyltransferase, partial [Chloroflexota bacterium]|nr:GNAT family N-acetyltransferase [Chloroflexota bacterium]
YNIGSIRAYEKAGFREIGRRRWAQLLAGCRYDVVLMDCLADEFIPPPTRALPDVDDLSPPLSRPDGRGGQGGEGSPPRCGVITRTP